MTHDRRTGREIHYRSPVPAVSPYALHRRGDHCTEAAQGAIERTFGGGRRDLSSPEGVERCGEAADRAVRRHRRRRGGRRRTAITATKRKGRPFGSPFSE